MDETGTTEPCCPKCETPIAKGIAFCEKCGERLQEGVERKSAPKRNRLGSLIGSHHKKQLRGARVAIIVVAVFTFLGAGIIMMAKKDFDRQVNAARYNPTMTVDEDFVKSTELGMGIMLTMTLVLGGVYIALYLWSRAQPFQATLIALILYITTQLLQFVLVPQAMANPIAWLIRIAIVLALVKGLQSAQTYRRMVAMDPDAA